MKSVCTNRNTIAILVRGSCFAVLLLFVNIFLVAQIFTLSGESFTTVALFSIVRASGQMASYFFAVLFCKKFKATRVSQFGSLLACGFILMVVLWQDGLQNFYLLFGAVWGLASGVHIATGQFLQSHGFGREKVRSNLIWLHSITALIGIVFPFTFGLVIDLGSLTLTSIMVLAITLVKVVATFMITSERDASRRLQPIQYFRALRKNNFTKASWILWIISLLSGFVLTINLLTTVMVVLTFGSNISLGFLISGFALGAVVFLIGYKYCRGWAKLSIIIACVFVPFFASIPLLFHIGVITVAFFQGGFLIFNKVIMTEAKATKISAVKYWGGEEFLLESNLFYEAAHWIGKILAGLLVLVIGLVGATPLIMAIIIVLMLLIYSIYAAGLFLWQRRYIQPLKIILPHSSQMP